MTPEQLLQIIPLLIGAILIEGTALTILTYLVLKSKGEAPKIEEVFTIHKTGLLIRHVGNHEDDQTDNDIFCSMLTTVQEFIKDSFRSRDPSDLKNIEFGDKNLLMDRGDYIFLAVVYSGDANRKMRERIKKTITNIEILYRAALDGWDGDLGRLKSIDQLTMPLIDAAHS
jgi:hypothetical protein